METQLALGHAVLWEVCKSSSCKGQSRRSIVHAPWIRWIFGRGQRWICAVNLLNLVIVDVGFRDVDGVGYAAGANGKPSNVVVCLDRRVADARRGRLPDFDADGSPLYYQRGTIPHAYCTFH